MVVEAFMVIFGGANVALLGGIFFRLGRVCATIENHAERIVQLEAAR